MLLLSRHPEKRKNQPQYLIKVSSYGLLDVIKVSGYGLLDVIKVSGVIPIFSLLILSVGYIVSQGDPAPFFGNLSVTTVPIFLLGDCLYYAIQNNVI